MFGYNTETSIRLADQYNDYLSFKGKYENKIGMYDIPLPVLRAGTRMKIPFFHYVYNDGIELTKDIYNPEAFEKWKKNHKPKIKYTEFHEHSIIRLKKLMVNYI